MFEKVLVANRGEIACRVIQACRELGLRTVAVYSEADRGALHTRMADEAICIGPPPNRDSYLNVANIISAAVVSGADAVHPGYGNLSEDATFAEACEACNIRFIGPPAPVIARMGDKAEARRVAREAGVPVVPGSFGLLSDAREARQVAAEVGYPIMLKAVAGGGGRGIRIAHNPQQLSDFFEQARTEARAAFGNGHVYMEKYVPEPRHIEVQIIADSFGTYVHLGERECSIQHRHQKLLEESPAPGVNSALRRRLGDAAVKVAQAVGYVNAGTIEFLMDSKGRFFFIEMNTRIQVEHPVTEMITRVDIVREQVRVAAGEKLSFEQGRILFNGHAIECRILAADGERNFQPSPGVITNWYVPPGPGVRVDSGVSAGSVVGTFYDPMVAKVIAWDQTRVGAIGRMEATLRGMVVEGIKTTIPLHLRILGNAYFRAGMVNTHFLERHIRAEEPV
jgi:acetyl-CoA carboxylase biotin carboxylase subunit